MKEALVLTVISADKPGLVETLSQAISECEGNWEESRMARLGGRFAGMLLITVDADRVGELEQKLAAVEQSGLKVTVERADATPEHGAWSCWRIELVGQDHPGIVRDVAGVLAERGINVEELSTACESAPMAGHPLFKLTADIAAPPQVDLEELQTHLESLAGDLMVDISLRGPSDDG